MAETATAPIALFKKRKSAATTIRKRPATPPPESASDDSDYASDDNADGARGIKRQRRGGINASVAIEKHSDTALPLTADSHAADSAAMITAQDDATRTSHIDLLGHKERAGTSRGGDTSKGKDDANGNAVHKKTVGPTKAPSNLRTVTFYDMKPDVCKDYKQTGFCGFGDNCKFLHAREDYKQGWELDRDWEISTKGKKVKGQIVGSVNKKKGDGAVEIDEDERLKDIPFACFICKEAYKFPIVTKCGHYFCENCALGRYRTTPACAACGAGTGGVFNAARDLNKLLERKRTKEAEEEKEEEDEE